MFFVTELTQLSTGMEVVELALVPVSAVLQQAPHLGTGAKCPMFVRTEHINKPDNQFLTPCEMENPSLLCNTSHWSSK